MGFDLVAKFKEGGPVMWPLLVFSAFTMLFTIERIIVILIQKSKLSPGKFLDAFEASFKKNNGDTEKIADEMLVLCKKKGGVAADIFSEGLIKFKHSRKLKMGPIEMKQWLTSAIEERARIELPQLESHLGIISTIAYVAPLVGLLGTVLGMIQSFEVMASSAGGAKPDELAGGISVALLTTVGGLVVAIPSLIFFNALKGWVEGIVTRIEEAAINLIDMLIMEGKEA